MFCLAHDAAALHDVHRFTSFTRHMSITRTMISYGNWLILAVLPEICTSTCWLLCDEAVLSHLQSVQAIAHDSFAAQLSRIFKIQIFSGLGPLHCQSMRLVPAACASGTWQSCWPCLPHARNLALSPKSYQPNLSKLEVRCQPEPGILFQSCALAAQHQWLVHLIEQGQH